MEKENSTPLGAANAKKRKFSMGVGQSPLINVELDAKNYEIEKLKELVQTLHERVYNLEEEKENNWAANGIETKETEEAAAADMKNGDTKQNDDKKSNNDENVKELEAIVKEKEEKIKAMETELNGKTENEQKLQAKITKLEDANKNFLQQVSNLMNENRSLKEKLNNETALNEVTVDKIHNEAGGINFDVLSSENVLVVPKLKSSESPSWKLFSSETAEPFEMDIPKIYKRTQFRINLNGSLICIDQENPNRLNEITQSIYTWTHKHLRLGFQTLDEYTFKKLASETVKRCKLQNITVTKSNGDAMRADEIFAEFPLVEEFEYCFKRYHIEPLSNVDEKFTKLTKYKNLKKFKLCNITNRFNLEVFGKFMAKHPNTEFIIQYHHECKNEKAQFKIQQLVEKLSKTCKVSVEFAEK